MKSKLKGYFKFKVGRAMDIEEVFQVVRLHDEKVINYIGTKVSVNAVNFEKQSLLQEAIAFKNRLVINKLLSLDININHQDKTGRSALHSAITHDDFMSVQLLIGKGIDVNLLDQHGNGALWTAILKPRVNYELVELLVNKGANIHHKNKYNRSPMSIAETKNNEKLLNILKTSTS